VFASLFLACSPPCTFKFLRILTCLKGNFGGSRTRFCLRVKAFGLLKGWVQQGLGMVCRFILSD